MFHNSYRKAPEVPTHSEAQLVESTTNVLASFLFNIIIYIIDSHLHPMFVSPRQELRIAVTKEDLPSFEYVGDKDSIKVANMWCYSQKLAISTSQAILTSNPTCIDVEYGCCDIVWLWFCPRRCFGCIPAIKRLPGASGLST